MALNNIQQKNYDFFAKNLQQFLSDPTKTGKFLVIKDEAVKGAYDDFDAALRFAVANLGSDFVIQQVIDEKKAINYLACSL